LVNYVGQLSFIHIEYFLCHLIFFSLQHTQKFSKHLQHHIQLNPVIQARLHCSGAPVSCRSLSVRPSQCCQLPKRVNGSTVNLLRYIFCWFSGGVVTYAPSYILVNLNCSYMYWFQFLRNYCFYVLMLCTFEIDGLFQPKYVCIPLPPHRWVMVRSACFMF
jgi:hypothetical protein